MLKNQKEKRSKQHSKRTSKKEKLNLKISMKEKVGSGIKFKNRELQNFLLLLKNLFVNYRHKEKITDTKRNILNYRH